MFFRFLNCSFISRLVLSILPLGLALGQDSEGQIGPNILWITCEDISPAWGCYGDTLAWTPHIDNLASNGYIYTNAFSNAPICAPARSTLITGMYATSLGTQHLRSEIPVPAELKILPELLRRQGYYTSNNAKTDYNFGPAGRWDSLGSAAHWRYRKSHQPFFSVFNFGITHEGHANRYDPKDTYQLDKKHDPSSMVLPPYFPDTDEFRKILAHQYDLITVFDQEVGRLFEQLESDDLLDETIIFVFSDHGFGLPRYKRWLYDTGLRVPFVLYLPDQYRGLVNGMPPGQVTDLVAFVDFAPTVLNLAGCEVPDWMEGNVFLGEQTLPKQYVFGYRDRADDAYDMSRSVFDGRFLYVRNYMPHIPYIQNAVIFNQGKWSYNELHRLKAKNQLSDEAKKLFQGKPVEELYDLEADPHELRNLVDNLEQSERVNQLKVVLHNHIIKTCDTGLLNEGEMMSRAGEGSVFEMARDSRRFQPEVVLRAAEQVGKVEDVRALESFIQSSDPAVRFWALQALQAFAGGLEPPAEDWIRAALRDPSLPNRTLAAEIAIRKWPDESFRTLREALQTNDEVMLLQAAISTRRIGGEAKPLISFVEDEIYPRIAGDIWGRYKSWSYPMFIGMALDQVLINCGREIQVR